MTPDQIYDSIRDLDPAPGLFARMAKDQDDQPTVEDYAEAYGLLELKYQMAVDLLAQQERLLQRYAQRRRFWRLLAWNLGCLAWGFAVGLVVWRMTR